MSIFNSLGSNYNLRFVLKALFTTSSKKSIQDLKEYLQDRYKGKVILLYKGRQALETVLCSLDLPQGSKVVINGFTCYAVYEATTGSGLKTVYLDIEQQDLNFSAKTLKTYLDKDPKIKVVIIQNTLGYPCDIVEIYRICQQKKVLLIEDLAHSIGARYTNGSEAGTVGDFTVLSFSQDKVIDAVSGGALITRTPKYGITTDSLKDPSQKIYLIDRLYPLFTYLIRTFYQIGLGKILHFILKKLDLLSKPMEGISSTNELPGWYCNLALNQFKRLDENLNHRRRIAQIYADLLDPKLTIKNIVGTISSSSNLRFPILVEDREKLIKFLAKQQIFISDIWYDGPVGPKKYLPLTDYNGQCPVSETVSSKIVNLPTHINVSYDQAKNITKLVNQWIRSK